MPFAGTIVSHDLSLHTGLVLPDGKQQAISFTEGDVLNWRRNSPLFGERVSFEVVQTPQGYAAIQMFLLNERPQISFTSREMVASLTPPLLVGITTYLVSHFLLTPLIFAYLPAINFITVILFFLVAGTPRSHRPRPPEVMLMILAICGGAPALMLLLLFTRTRLRSEGMMVFVFALVIMQATLLKKYQPGVFDRAAWSLYFSSSNLNRLNVPTFNAME
ncbi:MAG: hypothetical protein RL518_1432 [Pseudomonadota bacterium]|jgi:uncharacterized membrane protein YsdA (DUF1294 family)